MSARARKPWDLTEEEQLPSFQNWESVVYHNISLDPNWVVFLPPSGRHSTWKEYSKTALTRGLTNDTANDVEKEADRKTAI